MLILATTNVLCLAPNDEVAERMQNYGLVSGYHFPLRVSPMVRMNGSAWPVNFKIRFSNNFVLKKNIS